MLVVCTANLEKNEENDSDEQEEGCDEGPGFTCSRRSLELWFREIRVALLDCCRSGVLRPAATEKTHGLYGVHGLTTVNQ